MSHGKGAASPLGTGQSGLFVAALACGLALLPGHAAAAPVSAVAKYAITMSGVNVATAVISLKDDGSRYSLDISAKVAGLAQLVASGTAQVDSTGTSGRNGLEANNFDLKTVASGDTFTTTIQYRGGDVTAFIVDPPVTNNIDRVPIERKQLVQVNDPIAPFVLKGRALDKSLCNRNLRIFSGVERFDIDLTFASMQTATSLRTGYQGPVVLCSMRYKPISGHYTTSDVTNYLADSDRILIWYAPLGTTGTFIPYRVLIGTTVGDLSMVLTDLQQDDGNLATK
ncbi:MAG TPA: DUF3108 domain-containing protein [Devosiaceae bacterium]